MTPAETRRWQWLALALVIGALLWLLAPVLTPFVISALFGWLGDPLVDRLEARGRSRNTSVLIVFAVMLVALALVTLVLVPMLWEQLQHLFDWLPQLAAWATGVLLPWIKLRFRLDLAPYVDPAYVFGLVRSHWEEAGGIAAAVLGRVTASGKLVFGLLANVALVPVLSFYFLRDWDVLIARIRELVPRPMLPVVSQLARESNDVLGGFLRGQLSVMLALGSVYALGLWAVGLDLGLLIGFVAGLVSFVPYLGAFFGVTAAVIATLVQHGDLMHLALVLGVFAVGQTLESFVLTPWLVGDRIGLHPVAVIFAIMAGGQLFGFLGVLLALPVAAVGMVMLRYAHQRYRGSGLYGAHPDPASASALPLPDPGAMQAVDAARAREGGVSPRRPADAPASAAVPPIPPVTPP
jgi:predicted PurR-regulated permease PerM